MANKTLEVPVQFKDGTNSTMKVTGYVVKLMVGDEQHRFLIHHPVNGDVGKHLTHIESRQKVGSLNSAGISFMVGTGKRLTERGQAEHLIQSLVAKHGADVVLQKLKQQ